MLQILHIAVHMGGGVGKVLSGIASGTKINETGNHHKILLLEYPEKMNFIDLCKKYDIDVLIATDIKVIKEEMLKADIVQLEWWHHPKMAELLHEFPEVPVRLLIWSHISGCNYPVLPFQFVKAPHRFLFTSKYSLENPYWSKEQREAVGEITEVVNSSGGFDNMPQLVKTEHNGFNIGYIGTLNYCKLHPDFADYYAAVDIPDVKFIFVGDNENQYVIEQDAKRKGIIEKLEFTGYSNDINKEFSRFDVFAYLLNPDHFGTTENILLEAMAYGLPVIILNQCAEKYLVEHMVTGLVVNNIEEFANYVRYLYEYPSERKRIGDNARTFVINEFSSKKTIKKLDKNYSIISSMNKRNFNFGRIFGDQPYNWFLSCLGFEREIFEDSLNKENLTDESKILQIENKIRNCRLILKERSKSSINQFVRYFPQDRNLRYWHSLINGK